MPILNYTTDVSCKKTAGELQGMLAAKGAQRVSVPSTFDCRAMLKAFSELCFEQTFIGERRPKSMRET